MAKKPAHSRKLSVYSNLSHRRKTQKDEKARTRAQYLATLPKDPVKRFFYSINPKRFWAYWFSKRGAMTFLKIAGVATLILALLVGGLFAYFRKDLDSIRPDELAKRVQSTVTTYLDRSGKLLWQDKGNDDYKLVVKSDELNKYLKQATVAIEDRDFYKHGGVSPIGLTRAVFNNLTGGDTQGGSTLTQQLVKQVFFPPDQASDRSGASGIARKIKELILSVEVERMYDKDQILTLYLNESPYGGRRNGAESASQTYFGKSAKDLTIAEAALLAAIPQNPTTFNPYKISGHEALISRQHTVIANMLEQNYITKAEADAAKAYPILDHINPEESRYTNIKAPHFVQMVSTQLESQLGKATVGQGGLTVTTTLDLDIQNKLEEAMATMFNSSKPINAGFSNGAATVEDTKSGQIVAMMGSRSFTYPGYGQDNAAISYIQPGSTVKALVYAQLFQKKPDGQANYGSGTILKDENIDAIYGAKVQNADRKFLGNVSIRTSLATSRNIPAIKAMYINTVKTTIDQMHAMGATSYCTQGSEVQVGLAAAIGGCGIKQTDLVNAYATLGRQGVYKPQSSVLKVTNSSGDILQQWTDPAGKKIIDPQSAFIVSDILNDDVARRPLDGPNAVGMAIPGVKTSTKTGTSDRNGQAKDIWMVSYSPALTMGVWLGNSDATVLKSGTSSIPGPIIGTVMSYAHKTVYASQGKWKAGDWYPTPAGIQKVGSEYYPAWWKANQGQTNTQVDFDRVSKYKATQYTPASAKISLAVTKSTDPVTKKDVYTNVPDGYDGAKDDDVHLAGDTGPSIASSSVWTGAANNWVSTISVSVGSNARSTISSVVVTIGGIGYTAATTNGTLWTVTYNGAGKPGTGTSSVLATDQNYYTSGSYSY